MEAACSIHCVSRLSAVLTQLGELHCSHVWKRREKTKQSTAVYLIVTTHTLFCFTSSWSARHRGCLKFEQVECRRQAVVILSECSYVPSAKTGLVCLCRPDQSWHSALYEGLVLQCKETAMVRHPPTHTTSQKRQPSQLGVSSRFASATLPAPNRGRSSALLLDRQEEKGSLVPFRNALK